MYIAVVLLSLFVTAQNSNAVTPDVYWSMDKIVYDDSGRAKVLPQIGDGAVFTGIAETNYSVETAGLLGNAITLHGGIDFPNITRMTSDCFVNPAHCKDGLSFSLWAKLNVPTSFISCFLSTSLYCSDTFAGVTISASASEIQSSIRPATGKEYTAKTAFSAVGLNRWVHLAVTWNITAGIKMYVNGSGAGTVSSQTMMTNTKTVIPTMRFGGLFRVIGLTLDEVKFWYKTLSNEDILKSMGAVTFPTIKPDSTFADSTFADTTFADTTFVDTTTTQTTKYSSVATTSNESSTLLGVATTVYPYAGNGLRYAIIAGCGVVLLIIFTVVFLLYRKSKNENRGFFAISYDETNTSVVSEQHGNDEM